MTPQQHIHVPQMCNTHQALLVTQCGYGPKDAWQALLIVTQIALLQGASVDPKVYKEVGGDAQRFKELGCLACRKPDLFGLIVHMANKTRRRHHIKAIKELGEQWIKEATKT